jgi:chemotaxis protein MotB
MAQNKPIKIIRRIEVIEGGGHHGGAWKVAYADFMTAMMAFFLLMWILSSADEQKLRGVAEYFTNATMPGGSGVLDGATLGPPGTLSASNGAIVARGSEIGKIDDPSPAQWEVRDVTPTPDPQQLIRGTTKGNNDNPAAGAAAKAYNSETDVDAEGERAGAGNTENDGTGEPDDSDAQKSLEIADQAQFDRLQAEILQAMQEDPDLRPLQENVIFERTPEGLRIQLIDQEGKPMFANGSPKMVDAARTLMKKLGASLASLPNLLAITGHTDSVPFTNRKSYDNWDLSTDRANSMRRVLAQSGVAPARVIGVAGKADTELLVPESPDDPSNRRITLLLQYRVALANHAGPKISGQASERPVKTKMDHADTSAHEASASGTTENAMTMLSDKAFNNLRSVLR